MAPNCFISASACDWAFARQPELRVRRPDCSFPGEESLRRDIALVGTAERFAVCVDRATSGWAAAPEPTLRASRTTASPSPAGPRDVSGPWLPVQHVG
jgi:hypothetical protein